MAGWALRGPRGNPLRRGHADFEILVCERCARTDLTALASQGPWPKLIRDAAKETVVKHASAHTAWGHRKTWMMTRRCGVQVSASTVMRALKNDNMLQSADRQRERRELAAARKGACLLAPSGLNQVW